MQPPTLCTILVELVFPNPFFNGNLSETYFLCCSKIRPRLRVRSVSSLCWCFLVDMWTCMFCLVPKETSQIVQMNGRWLRCTRRSWRLSCSTLKKLLSQNGQEWGFLWDVEFDEERPPLVLLASTLGFFAAYASSALGVRPPASVVSPFRPSDADVLGDPTAKDL